MQAKDLEAGAHWDVGYELGSAIKAFAAGTAGPHQQLIAYRFILEGLCGVDKMSFMPLAPDIPMILAWREGRRYVGIMLREIVAKPMEDPEPPPEPRGRTMTEAHRRRGPNPD